MFQHFHNTNFNPRTTNKLVFFSNVSKVLFFSSRHYFLMN
nr:MAG TPA: hypothetical protein [Bacteriophage sp.]